MSQPWMKFYPSDWRADPRLRMCSLAARGLWMEMLALMHEATPYGHLLISGISPTDAQLAVLAGAPSDQIPDLLGELESAGVFSRTEGSVIVSDITDWVGAGVIERTLTHSAKRRIYERDGRVCAYCRDQEGPFEIDHVHPVSRGGSDDEGNLVVACKVCNRAKGDLTLDEWGA